MTAATPKTAASRLVEVPGRLIALWRPTSLSLSAVLHVWERNARLYRAAYKRTIIPNFFEPIFYLLAIGFGIGSYIGQSIGGIDYIAYIAPGLMAASAMNGAVFEVTYNIFARLRWTRIYDALVTAPVEPADICLGELLWAVTRSLIYGLSFLVVLLVAGWVQSPWAVLAPIGVILIGAVFGLIGLIYTILIRDASFYSYFFTFFMTPMLLFSGLFFPVSKLPGAVQALVWFSPLLHGVELLRALILSGSLSDAATNGAWLVVGLLMLIPPAVNLMHRRLLT